MPKIDNSSNPNPNIIARQKQENAKKNQGPTDIKYETNVEPLDEYESYVLIRASHVLFLLPCLYIAFNVIFVFGKLFNPSPHVLWLAIFMIISYIVFIFFIIIILAVLKRIKLRYFTTYNYEERRLIKGFTLEPEPCRALFGICFLIILIWCMFLDLGQDTPSKLAFNFLMTKDATNCEDNNMFNSQIKHKELQQTFGFTP